MDVTVGVQGEQTFVVRQREHVYTGHVRAQAELGERGGIMITWTELLFTHLNIGIVLR